MRIDIATLFPDMCEAVLSESIIGRARKAGKIELFCHQIRDYTTDKHRRVDDTPYGGGMGMVMQADPIYRCFNGVTADFQEKCLKFESEKIEKYFGSGLSGICGFWNFLIKVFYLNIQMNFCRMNCSCGKIQNRIFLVLKI